MTAEQKARELVKDLGFDKAYGHCQIMAGQRYNEKDIKGFNFWQSVREHILKLKNEGKVK